MLIVEITLVEGRTSEQKELLQRCARANAASDWVGTATTCEPYPRVPLAHGVQAASRSPLAGEPMSGCASGRRRSPPPRHRRASDDDTT